MTTIPSPYPQATDTVANNSWFKGSSIGVTDRLPAGLNVAAAFEHSLPWDVAEDTAINGSTLDVVPDLKLVRRDDNNEVIGWGRQSYRPITNAEVVEILDSGLDGVDYEVAAVGSLRRGARVFVAVQLHDSGEINVDGETIHPYILLHNTFDGSSTLRLVNIGFRPFCTNVLSLSLRTAHRVTEIRHTVNAGTRFPEVRQALKRFTIARDEFQRDVQDLIRTEVSKADAARVIEALTPQPKTDDEEQPSKAAVTRAERRRDELTAAYNSDPRVGFTGTAWGLVQAYSTWVQNDSGFRNTANGPVDRNERKIEWAVNGGEREHKVVKVIDRVLTPA